MSTFLNTLLRRNLEPATPIRPRRASRFEPWQAMHSPPPDEAMPIQEQPTLPDRPIGTVQRPAAPAPPQLNDTHEPVADGTRPETPQPSEAPSAEPPRRSEVPKTLLSLEPSSPPDTVSSPEEPAPPNASVRPVAPEARLPFPDVPPQHRSKLAPETPTTDPKRTVSTHAKPRILPAEPSVLSSAEQDARSTEEQRGLTPAAIRPLESDPDGATSASRSSPTEPPRGSDALEAASLSLDTPVRPRPKLTSETRSIDPARTVSIRAVPRTPRAVAFGQQASSGRPQAAKPKQDSRPSMSASAEHAEPDPIAPPPPPGSVAPKSVNAVPTETAQYPAQDARSAAPVEKTPSTIRVSIGRIDVRAVTPPQTAQRTPARSAPALSLDDYLKQHSERR